jgi:predicted dehydrogenase
MKPRLAFVGLGWIGRHRLQAILDGGGADIVTLADACEDAREAAHALSPTSRIVASFDEALAQDVDGVVLATPSALHADQSIRALHAGVAVFCQKPLGRNADEVGRVVDAARRANRLLGVDVSYRYTEGLARIRDLMRSGALGTVYALDLMFHNAYGPDKPWFYDMAQSGGGCLLDLGTHLVDFLHWTLDEPAVRVSGSVFADGERLAPGSRRVEDFAIGEIEMAGGAVARLACSWRLPAGCDAQIGVSAFGTRGGVGFRNVNGSFYDFVAERYIGTTTETLCLPPDAWGGRAAAAWAAQLADSPAYDPAIETAVTVATTLDRLYGRDTVTLTR